jgi:translocator protein
VKVMVRGGRKRRWASLLVWLGLCYGVSALAGMATVHAVETWYPTLMKPAGTPPNWVFEPVWMALYGLMAVAAWLVWTAEDGVTRRRAIVWFCVQLAANLVWSFVFFGMQRTELGMLDITLLWFFIVATMVLFFKVSRVAGWLLVPYLAWVTYAGYLNWGVWTLNR